jgi:outer membrane receptor protein involved in Fe transport
MKAVFCILLLCFSIAGLTAQTFRGSIQGTVADSSKAAVPGAEVTVISPETGLKRTTITNDAGEYVVTELPLGAFDITVKKDGFRTQVLKGVRVEVAASQRLDVTLDPGSVSESVDVTAQAPLVESAENNMGGTLEATQFSELPVNGRDFTKLLVMVPGSGGDPSGAADSAGSFGLFSINGNRGRSNNYLIDGTDMNDGYRNLPAINQGGVFGTPATVLPIDALEQISVINSTEAEYGRSSGATVNIVTKSGTNSIHGSAYEYFRNSALDARNFFNPVGNPQNAFHNNQFGFSLGGPLVKNKTFWFASYEGDREAVGIPTVATVPSSAQLNQAIADNGGVVNPVIARLLARNPWSLPASGSGNLITSDRGSNRADSVIAKIDHHIGESDLLTARYFYSNSDQSFPLALVGGGILPGFNTVTPTNLNIASVSYTHVFTPAFLMETRFGYNRFDESFSPQDHTFDPGAIGLNTGVTGQDLGLPLITVKNLAPPGSTTSGQSFAPLGAAASSPRGRIDTNWQFLNNFSYSAGRHHWKFGYEYRRTNVHGFFDNGYRGTLTFNTLDDFIAGMPDSGRQAQGNSTRNTFQNNNSLYLQDSFRLFPRLTINYGVRWEYFGVIGETQNQFSILDPTGNLKQVSQLYPRDLNNFAPRASFAWDVFGNAKTVVRSGWGLYYDAFSQDFFVGQLPFNTFNSGPAYNGIGPNPITFSFSPSAVLDPTTRVFAPSTFGATDVFTVDQKLRTPYIQVYNLNIEQELAKNVALQVGYVGSAGRKLFRFLDLNQTNPATGTVAFPSLGFVNQFQSSASSSYNSLQASLHLRDWHRLTSTVSYTWSHSIDNASDGQDYVPNASQPDNSFRPDLERASSNFDLRHHFSWAYGYRFPDPQSMKLLTNGWGIDGVLTLNAGQPYNVNYLFEGNFNGSGEFFGRPDLVGNPFAGTHAPNNFLNLSAFQVPCTVDGSGNCLPGTQHFGNLGRNAFTGPAYKNLDFSLVKDSKINERVTLQFRVNAFNILNHPNFANPLWPNFAVDFLQNGQSANGRGVGFLPITTTPDVGVGNPFLGGGGSRNLELAMRVKF